MSEELCGDGDRAGAVAPAGVGGVGVLEGMFWGGDLGGAYRVTLVGSPPKAEMYLLIQRRASRSANRTD